jgi:hypothetical protein
MSGSFQRYASCLLSAGFVILTVAMIAPLDLQGQDVISLGVSPLQGAEKDGATVIREQGGEWITLREGSGTFVCIADDPSDDRFRATCYHKSLEPYMARGRELREQGVDGAENVQKRREEIASGTLEMPRYGLLFQINAPGGWSGDAPTANRRTVIYVPYAQSEDLGLPTSPSEGPWFMHSGLATAHIMISG